VKGDIESKKEFPELTKGNIFIYEFRRKGQENGVQGEQPKEHKEEVKENGNEGKVGGEVIVPTETKQEAAEGKHEEV
jgi:hypothetical protein